MKIINQLQKTLRHEKIDNTDEENEYIKERWMGADITNTYLAFDKDLSKLQADEFREELNK